MRRLEIESPESGDRVRVASPMSEHVQSLCAEFVPLVEYSESPEVQASSGMQSCSPTACKSPRQQSAH